MITIVKTIINVIKNNIKDNSCKKIGVLVLSSNLYLLQLFVGHDCDLFTGFKLTNLILEKGLGNLRSFSV